MFRTVLLSFCVLGVVPPVFAQDEGNELDTITVTGSRIGYSDLLDTPAVSLTKSLFTISACFALSHRTRGTRRSEGMDVHP